MLLAVGRSLYVGSFTGGGPPLSLLHQRADGSVEDVACWSYSGGCRSGPALSPVGMAVSPDEANLYVASQVEDAHEGNTMERISVFRRNRSTGMVVPLHRRSACIAMGADNYRDVCAHGYGFGAPSDVTVSPDGRNVYLAGDGGVATFSRASADGSLRQFGCVGVSLTADRCHPSYLPVSKDYAKALAAGHDGTSVYVLAEHWHGDRDTTVLEVFRRGRGGALSRLAGDGRCFSAATVPRARCRVLPALASGGTAAIAISPDGRNLYVSTLTSVLSFTPGPAGRLRFDRAVPLGRSVCRCTPFAATSIAARQDRVYVESGADGRILVFIRAPRSGALERPLTGACIFASKHPPRGCSTARATTSLTALTASPDGRYLYGVGYFEGAMTPTGYAQEAELAVFAAVR